MALDKNEGVVKRTRPTAEPQSAWWHMLPSAESSGQFEGRAQDEVTAGESREDSAQVDEHVRGVQNVSRPTLSCHEISRTPPTTLEETATTFAQMYHGMESDLVEEPLSASTKAGL